ncbi:MAG: ABC transporter ATP-binding protein [Bryobacteraceae bacterium]|nr:ABC transporter ATP-binding protein [Bryobacteraceae bacterium]MDW8380450.1 ABC transporter ATP-binding protein [Bryobacterales bacterium]
MDLRDSPFLRCWGLKKSFGAVRAVDGVSFEIYPGEIVGLLGPNGAGKTTALRMLAGILTPDEGSVEACGFDMKLNPLEAKRRIGFLSGDTQLYQRLTPREILLYFGELFEVEASQRQRRAAELIDMLNMGSFADRPCETLSAGQKQRANIARAFFHDPEVLILDEPTTALDILSGRFIVDAIRQQSSRGKAVLFSTHIMGEAEYLCDRIIMIHQGRIAETGSQAEILARLGTTNLTDAFLKAIGES